MNRSGKLLAVNDKYIEEMLINNLYDIRSDGTIWTLIQRTGKVSVKGLWRKTGQRKKNYWCVSYKPEGKNSIKLAIHRVIYAKFIGKLEKDLVINHKNNDGFDNTVGNLELDTQSHNNKHKFKMGLKPIIGNKKINDEIANNIRNDRKEGLSYRLLALKYSLCKSSIAFIIQNKTWNRG